MFACVLCPAPSRGVSTGFVMSEAKAEVVVGSIIATIVFLIVWLLVSVALYAALIVFNQFAGAGPNGPSIFAKMVCMGLASFGGVKAGKWAVEAACKRWIRWAPILVLSAYYAYWVVTTAPEVEKTTSPLTFVLNNIQALTGIIAGYFLLARVKKPFGPTATNLSSSGPPDATSQP